MSSFNAPITQSRYGQIERGRSATRFEPPPVPPPAPRGPIGEPMLEGEAPDRTRPAAPTPEAPRPGLAPSGPKPEEEESYTNRLLRAKKKVWEDREKDKDKDQ